MGSRGERDGHHSRSSKQDTATSPCESELARVTIKTLGSKGNMSPYRNETKHQRVTRKTHVYMLYNAIQYYTSALQCYIKCSGLFCYFFSFPCLSLFHLPSFTFPYLLPLSFSYILSFFPFTSLSPSFPFPHSLDSPSSPFLYSLDFFPFPSFSPPFPFLYSHPLFISLILSPFPFSLFYPSFPLLRTKFKTRKT